MVSSYTLLADDMTQVMDLLLSKAAFGQLDFSLINIQELKDLLQMLQMVFKCGVVHQYIVKEY
jgi:hypothetical protein